MLTGSQRTKNFCKFGYYSNLSESSLGVASVFLPEGDFLSCFFVGC